ncbi:hypothetical protein EVAR_45248_1 [Eumeta japonica]|uniref:Uncharacterized protein n=1 Tax=Eumeta variegata TaxID=151549 RepID=A0A4C1XG05_EUMVA|nr:hypothetical protein EVAR_45248_1 [Eumeta japonica]
MYSSFRTTLKTNDDLEKPNMLLHTKNHHKKCYDKKLLFLSQWTSRRLKKLPEMSAATGPQWLDQHCSGAALPSSLLSIRNYEVCEEPIVTIRSATNP